MDIYTFSHEASNLMQETYINTKLPADKNENIDIGFVHEIGCFMTESKCSAHTAPSNSYNESIDIQIV